MAKFKKVLALVLSLAMVLTLAPIANVQTKAASKYKIKAATTAIAAGKTYNVKVTGVAKTQYVKIARSAGVTVKYNKKTIKASKKVVGTGKTLTFKVTVPDKVANYKSTIKAVIYNKKTNKKVKTLSTKRTVKVSELAIKSVEPATAQAGATIKYLIVNFTKAIDTLDASEVEIRRVDTDQLYTVDSVKLAANGKSATITLLGNDQAQNTTYLQRNVEYKLSVTKNGATATNTFSIPGIAADVSISAVDAAKKTISVGAMTFTVPDSIKIDYQEVLGRTATFNYDKNLVISKFALADEKVVYGAFAVSNGSGANDAYIADVVTGTKYYSQAQITTGTATIEPTRMIFKDKDGADDNWGVQDFEWFNDKVGLAYAKLVLNSNGTVKYAVVNDEWSNGAQVKTGNVLVTKVVGTTVYGGTTPIDLKNYTIVKDGKTIAITDIVENDVVFFNSTNKFAEVYNSSKTGALEAVYDGRFTFGGVTYDVETPAAKTPAALLSKVRYIAKDGGLTDVDNDYLNNLAAGKKDVTVYFSRTGAPVFLTGEPAAAKTSTKVVVLTDVAKTFNQSLVNYLRIAGNDGEAAKNYDVDITKLEQINDNDGDKYAVGYVAKDTTGKKAKNTEAGITRFFVGDADPATTEVTSGFANASGYINYATKVGSNAEVKTNAALIKGSTTLTKKSAVTLTFNDKDEVIGINFQDATTNALKTGTSFVPSLSKVTVQAGATYQITGSTPIYSYNDDTNAVTKTTYDKFVGATKTDSAAKVHVYSYDNKNVSFVVIESGAMDANSTGQTVHRAVVTSVEYSADSAKKMVKISLIDGNGIFTEAEYKDFGKDIKTKDSVAVGSIVDVTLAADKKTINNVENVELHDDAVLTVTDPDKEEFNLASKTGTSYATKVNLSSSEKAKPILAQITSTGVKEINFAQLSSLSDDFLVKYATLTSAFVDAVVVTTEANPNKSSGVSAPITFTSDKGDVIADPDDAEDFLASVAATKLTASVSLDDGLTVEKYEWYLVTPGASAEKIAGETTRTLSMTNAATTKGSAIAAGDHVYVVATDSDNNKNYSGWVTFKTAHYASCGDPTIADGAKTIVINNAVDQFGYAWTFAIDNKTVTLNGATFTASESAAGTVKFTYSGTWSAEKSAGTKLSGTVADNDNLKLEVTVKALTASTGVANNDVTAATLTYVE